MNIEKKEKTKDDINEDEEQDKKDKKSEIVMDIEKKSNDHFQILLEEDLMPKLDDMMEFKPEIEYLKNRGLEYADVIASVFYQL